MPAKKTATAPTTPISTTAADAHRMMLDGMTRRRDAHMRTAKEEVDRMIARLERLRASLELGVVPSALTDSPDARALAAAITAAESTDRAIDEARGWISMINA
jgi:hypothetical protein